MTTESQKAFEAWYAADGFKHIGMTHDTVVKMYSQNAWQASREHIRAKLQSGVMVEKVAAALFENEKKTMGDAWYHPSETFKGLGSIAAEPWIKNAKAAIAAVLEGI